MANLAYYKQKLDISTQDGAFARFTETLANYFNAAYYVDWEKAFANTGLLERDFALLNTLCRKTDIKRAATDLFMQNPQVIRALPILMAYRRGISLFIDPGDMAEYTFVPSSSTGIRDEAEHYAAFLVHSGLAKLFEHIDNVGDYATGVEVGLDSNARKNRGGDCGIRAITPCLNDVEESIKNLVVRPEVGYDCLTHVGFSVPAAYKGVVWDFGFWLSDRRDRLVVMEVNHYGSSGSKPPAIAREYIGRQHTLKAAGIGFIWITDGLGWKSMLNPLRAAFDEIDYLMNISLASQGLLEFALTTLLLGQE